MVLASLAAFAPRVQSRCVAWASSVLIAATLPVAAQQSVRAPRSLRLVELGDYQPQDLWIGPTGVVRIAYVRGTQDGGGLLELRRNGALQIRPLLGAFPTAISSDGRYVCGMHIGESSEFEEIWWSTEDLVPHLIEPGHVGALAGIENTPQGLVIVGEHFGEAIDIRPPALYSQLPVPIVGSSYAMAVSADGSVYSGVAGERAVRWVNRVPELLDDPVGDNSRATAVSRDGSSFAGSGAGYRAVVWLAQDGRAMRILSDQGGEPFTGESLGVLDSGLAFGKGYRDGVTFGWIWHPDLGTNRVVRIEQWLAHWGLGPITVESVTDVEVSERGYHFALAGRHTGLFLTENWYAETPRF